jgi:hypothetical protein
MPIGYGWQCQTILSPLFALIYVLRLAKFYKFGTFWLLKSMLMAVGMEVSLETANEEAPRPPCPFLVTLSKSGNVKTNLLQEPRDDEPADH